MTHVGPSADTCLVDFAASLNNLIRGYSLPPTA